MILLLSFRGVLALPTDVSKGDARMDWWRDARFGMFIHWGLYSQCEGYWKGKSIDGIGEWIMKMAEIPVDEYERLAGTFTAERYDPEKWVQLAKQAGMKYIVITAKHHDGFALFKSEADPFNVVDATPYGKDIIAEFVQACNKHDMRIGLYYSQFQDWSYLGAGGNDWDQGYAYSKEGFRTYMEEKALPQVREILTNYGRIDMIWYDTPYGMSKDESEIFLNLARELQPDIIVSGRVGHEKGDYVQMEDNSLPKKRQDFDWEVPVTMNHTWAFKRDDQHWKSVEYLLWQLTYSVSMGGNYLLNIGPKADGSVPQPSIDRLEAIGEWMRVNREVVHGAGSSPFLYYFPWGSITQGPGKMYLNISDWPEGELSIFGIRNNIVKAYLLSSGEEVLFSTDNNYLVLELPVEPVDPYLGVVVLKVEGEPLIEDKLVQDHKGCIHLETALAENNTGKQLNMGAPLYWTEPTGSLRWEYTITKPGIFNVEIITTGRKQMAWPERPALWDGGHEVMILLDDDKQIRGIINQDRLELPPKDLYNDFKISEFGILRIDEPGQHSLELIPLKISSKNNAGLSVRMIRLVPAEDQLKQTMFK